MKLTNLLTAISALIAGTTALTIPDSSNSTFILSTSTAVPSSASSTPLPTTSLTPTTTLELGAPIRWTTTAITAGVSPKNTHPVGFGEPPNWRANEFSRRVQRMLDYVLVFPFLLVGFAAWCILGPMQYQLTKAPHMQAQIRRGMQERAMNVAIIKEEVARGKKMREEERSEKKRRQFAELHMAPMSEIQDPKVVEKAIIGH